MWKNIFRVFRVCLTSPPATPTGILKNQLTGSLLGKTGYAEAVHVSYDPAKVSLETLTKQFFKIINPISVNKQGNDLGSQYRTGLYYADEADKPVLEKVWKEIQGKYSQPLAVELLPLKNYYPAEEYHQDYLKRTQAAIAISALTVSKIFLQATETRWTQATTLSRRPKS